jgi:DNA helicase-2/ATP-dependent DNA helicase PcrA
VKYVLKTQAPRVRLDLARELNPEQRAVVEAPAGHLLVIAGAGTGKTRALTWRVARLVERGCPPERILLCTFTNRAAGEMVARVEGLLGIDMSRCSAGTFHHVGHRVLREWGDRIGLSPDFSILDSEDARTLLGTVIAERGPKELTARRFPQPGVLHGLLGLASGLRVPLLEVLRDRAPKLLDLEHPLAEIAGEFAERKRRMNVCDFDDLLTSWHRLLVDPRCAEAREALEKAYDHVLVDEYQDINALQGDLCDRMAARCGSLTCVGDDAQSIYSFRGADFSQIRGFTRRHPQATILELTINYRSTPEVLTLANRSIANNRDQHGKQLRPVRAGGMVPAVIPLRDVYQQAEFVAQRILELHHERSLPLRRIAVLYRNHSHGMELQVELTRRQIPFLVRSGVKFFEQSHVKDVLAYLRAHHNPQDLVAWNRLLRLWPGVGATTAQRLAESLAAAGAQLGTGVAALVAEHARGARGRSGTALTALADLWRRMETAAARGAGEEIRTVVTHHYAEYAERTFSNPNARREDLEHLATYAGHFPQPRDFLAEVALVQGISAESVVGGEPPEDSLVLSTIHQAKGLEWPVCFVLALAEGRFPMPQSLRTPSELEEERRLFYVAATRAADELYLCYPMLDESGEGLNRLLRASRFLAEIDLAPAVFERWDIDEVPELPP